MIVNLLLSKDIQKYFDLSIAYNYTELYEKGLQLRIKSNNFTKYPLNLARKLKYTNEKSKNVFLLIYWGIILILHKYYSLTLNIIKLLRFLKDKKVDIIHINNGGYPAANSCNAMVLAAKISGIKKIIYVVNNTAEGYSFFLRWFDLPIDCIIKKSVTMFVTGSINSKNILTNVLSLKEKKIISIYNGISNRKIILNKAEFLKKHLIPADRFIISTIARLELRKGHIYLLEAINQLKKENFSPMPIFVFEGEGPQYQNIINFISENELENIVIMIPYIEHVFDLISASDIIILPSIMSEDLPNIISEAMSLGKPIISTSIAGIPEQVINNDSGIIVEPRNSIFLKNAIKDLIQDSDKRDRFSIESSNLFNKQFTVELSVSNYIELYNSI